MQKDLLHLVPEEIGRQRQLQNDPLIRRFRLGSQSANIGASCGLGGACSSICFRNRRRRYDESRRTTSIGPALNFELIAERKLRRRQLTETGDIEITGRDLRGRQPAVTG